MDKNLIPVLQIIFKWRKTILWVVVLAAAFSIVLALSLPVYYKADTVFYAASPDLGKPEKIFGFTSTDMQYYGSEDDVDRLLSMSSSADMLDFIIDSFELMSYYGISPDRNGAQSLSRRELSGDLSILKTEESAIQLSMVHQDPEKAAAIAKAARNYIEDNIVNLLREGQRKVVSTFRSSIDEKKKEMQMLSDTLTYIREHYGIIDPQSQSEVLASLIASTESSLMGSKAQLETLKNTRGIPRDTISFLNAKVAGLEEKMKSLTDSSGSSYSNIKKYNEGINDYLYYDQQYRGVKNDLSNETRRLQYYESAINSEAPGIHVIEHVQVPQRKYKPSRTLIVLMTTFGALIFSILVILLIETYNKFPWDRVKNGTQ